MSKNLKQKEVIQVRVKEEEKASFEQAATLAGVSLSSWVRERLRTASIRELGAAGLKTPLLANIKL